MMDDLTARRLRLNLIWAIERMAAATTLMDLRDSELVADYFDRVDEDGSPFPNRAITEEESVSVRALSNALDLVLDQARLAKRERLGGKTVHGIDPEDLDAFGWFEIIPPLAEKAHALFLKRGLMDDGLRPEG